MPINYDVAYPKLQKQVLDFKSRSEAVLSALRSLNSLTRLVQDIDPFTAGRDLKNIAKAQEQVDRNISCVRHLYGTNESNSSKS